MIEKTANGTPAQKQGMNEINAKITQSSKMIVQWNFFVTFLQLIPFWTSMIKSLKKTANEAVKGANALMRVLLFMKKSVFWGHIETEKINLWKMFVYR